MLKVTFTLDEETVTRLRRLGERLGKPQSQVVRESLKHYEARSDKLSDDERRRLLEAIDRIIEAPRPRPRKAVEAELREIRESRRHDRRNR